jgi:hypothetical protein
MAISLKYESFKLLGYSRKKKQASAVPSAFLFSVGYGLASRGYLLPGPLSCRIVYYWRCTSVVQVRRVTHRAGAHGVT